MSHNHSRNSTCIYPFLFQEEKPKEEEGVIWAEPIQTIPKLTYYNNGKKNICCKTAYDYNYSYCEGYDQIRHRDDRKHNIKYMHIDVEVLKITKY